jgi:hypothetical protein
LEPSIVVHICNPSSQEGEQEDSEVETNLGYIMRYSLKNNNKGK